MLGKECILKAKGCFKIVFSKDTELYETELLSALCDAPCFRLVYIRS